MEFKVRIKCKCKCEYEIMSSSFRADEEICCPNCGFRVPENIEKPLKDGLLAFSKVEDFVDLNKNGEQEFGNSLHISVVVPDNDWGVFM